MVEYWMDQNHIDIAFIQETQINQNARQIRKNYTWYFSGNENDTNAHTWAGVGIIIKNKLVKYIDNIAPHNDRIISITLKQKLKILGIGVYAPTSEASEEEQLNVYETIKKNKKPIQSL